VAVFALQGLMSTEKWEPVFVSVDSFHNFTPSANAMALFAVAAELPAMDVRMATGALCPDVRKNQFDMTLTAVETPVHAAYGKSGGVVVKIRKGPDRLITGSVMAIPA
jgi:hypothetical protein